LLLCLILASLLASEARDSQAPLVFATVFVIVWLGAGIVTVNALLLGGTISFFQSVCVLGYCLAPLVIVAFVKYLLVQLSAMGSGTMRFIELAVVFGAYLWATTASVGFLAALVPEKRKLLATYPVGLFYLVLAWMIVVE
jgi:protein YIPF6